MPRHRIVFRNLENLFAPEDHPDRPDWLARAIGRDLRGWSESLFTRKIEQLGEVLLRVAWCCSPTTGAPAAAAPTRAAATA